MIESGRDRVHLHEPIFKKVFQAFGVAQSFEVPHLTNLLGGELGDEHIHSLGRQPDRAAQKRAEGMP